MTGTVEGPCDCTGPHFHTVVHQCCADVADLRARLAEVEALCDNRDGVFTTNRQLDAIRAAARGEGDRG